MKVVRTDLELEKVISRKGDWKLLRDQLTFNSSWFRLYNKQGFYPSNTVMAVL